MKQLSVIIPCDIPLSRLSGQLSALSEVLQSSGDSYEIFLVRGCAWMGQQADSQQSLASLAKVRLVRFAGPWSISGAISAGLSLAAGRFVVAIWPLQHYCPEEIHKLLKGLVRADIVFGRRRRPLFDRLLHQAVLLPRWLLLGNEVHEPDMVFWAARREAVCGIQLVPGLHRFLANFVLSRGYRVGEVYVHTDASATVSRANCRTLMDLLSVWWLTRRSHAYDYFQPEDTDEGDATILPMFSQAVMAQTGMIRKAA